MKLFLHQNRAPPYVQYDQFTLEYAAPPDLAGASPIAFGCPSPLQFSLLCADKFRPPINAMSLAKHPHFGPKMFSSLHAS